MSIDARHWNVGRASAALISCPCREQRRASRHVEPAMLLIAVPEAVRGGLETRQIEPKCSIGPSIARAKARPPHPEGCASVACPHGAAWPRARSRCRRLAHGRLFVTQSFSSLTRRIIFLNVTGLFALVIGIILSVSVPRRADRRARPEPFGSGRVIARAIAASATGETETSRSIRTGSSICSRAKVTALPRSALRDRFPINPERVAQCTAEARLSPTNTRPHL